MTKVVEVCTGARLHFGLFGTRSVGGQPLGGIGLMIDRPSYRMTVRLADEDEILGDADSKARAPIYLGRIREEIDRYFERVRAASGHEARAAGFRVRIEVSEAIPPHSGFGSGTQLAYAIGFALENLLPFKGLSVQLPEWLGRGERSDVGSLGANFGGFIADPGPSEAGWVEDIRAELASWRRRTAVPDGWRFVVVRPRSRGPSGAEEIEAFRRLAPMPAAAINRLGRIAARTILPSLKRGRLTPAGVATKRFRAFAAGVAEFNRLVGEHFAPVQGGVYAHPMVRDLARALAGTEWPYLAQSSWGPATAVFCESQESAERLLAFLEDLGTPGEADVFVASPLNRGAATRWWEGESRETSAQSREK